MEHKRLQQSTQVTTVKMQVQTKKMEIFFHEETKCSSVDLETFSKHSWKGVTLVALDTKGAAGGIGILWNPN